MENLKNNLINIWVPNWYFSFIDKENGGFHERIDKNQKPINTGYKRLLSQCRQIYTYSHALKEGTDKKLIEHVNSGYEFLTSKYKGKEKGSWIFSTTEKGDAKDTYYDLYAHAFVILSMAFYYNLTGEKHAKNNAKHTLNFIKTHFRSKNKGFEEALDEKMSPITSIRRQNPHMHLFEACLFAYDFFTDEEYLETAHEIYQLFKDYFFDDKTKTLTEFFDYELNPHKEKGHKIETGHHYEWVWLLNKYTQTTQINNDCYLSHLFDYAYKFGTDKNNHTIFNIMDKHGNILDKNKRIWHITEFMKAATIMNLKEKIDITKYINKDGFWIEILNEDMAAQSDFMPATTPYHITMGILETENIKK